MCIIYICIPGMYVYIYIGQGGRDIDTKLIPTSWSASVCGPVYEAGGLI